MSATRTSEQADQTASAAVPLLLAILGAVAGTLIAHAFEGSPNAGLLGAVLGAALPPFIAVAGPYSGLRAATGIVVSILALVVTYGGFTVVTATTKTQPFLPVIPVQGPATPPSTTEPSTPSTTDQSATVCEGTLCIKVTPKVLICSVDSCPKPVTVTNSGSKRLRIRSIEVDGSGAAGFTVDRACENRTLESQASCDIAVTPKPGQPADARLVIHQNLQGPPTFVALTTQSGPSAPDGGTDGPDVMMLNSLECSVVPGGALDGGDGLTIFVPVRNKGPGELHQLVPYTLVDDVGPRGSGNTAVSGSASTPMQLTLRPQDYAQVHHYTVTLDPENEIPESNESNNSLRVTVTLPPRPEQTQDVDCNAP